MAEKLPARDIPDHHWCGEEPDLDLVGFVYLITNNLSGMLYIGKKQYKVRRRVKVKGRKNRKIVVRGNKWEYYTGSSVWLNSDIAELGKEQFTFEILAQASSKSSLHYLEIELQVKADVLRAKDEEGNPIFYNKMIAGTKFIPKGECPAIAERQRGAQNTIFKAIKNGNHPTLGKGHSDKTKEDMSIRAKTWWDARTPEERADHHRKTARHGEQNGRAKLTYEKVVEMRKRWERGEFKYKAQLYREYGISNSQGFRVLSGQHWPAPTEDDND